MNRPNPAQAGTASAAQEAKQHGLGLVGASVPGRNRGAGARGNGLSKEPIATPAPFLLEVAAAACADGRQVTSPDVKRALETRRETADEFLVRIGIGPPQAVVDMQDSERARTEQVAESVQQCDRVRPAGDGDADRAVLGKHALAVNSFRDLSQHNLTVGEVSPRPRAQ